MEVDDLFPDAKAGGELITRTGGVTAVGHQVVPLEFPGQRDGHEGHSGDRNRADHNEPPVSPSSGGGTQHQECKAQRNGRRRAGDVEGGVLPHDDRGSKPSGTVK